MPRDHFKRTEAGPNTSDRARRGQGCDRGAPGADPTQVTKTDAAPSGRTPTKPTGTARARATRGGPYSALLLRRQGSGVRIGMCLPFGLNARQQNAWKYYGGGKEAMAPGPLQGLRHRAFPVRQHAPGDRSSKSPNQRQPKLPRLDGMEVYVVYPDALSPPLRRDV